MEGDPRARFVENPFHVLGVPPEAAPAEIEREGQRLLAMLELGLAAAATYATPLGPATRTPDLVRRALAELREPRRRLRHGLWARLPPVHDGPEGVGAPAAEPDPRGPWAEAFEALGWKAR